MDYVQLAYLRFFTGDSNSERERERDPGINKERERERKLSLCPASQATAALLLYRYVLTSRSPSSMYASRYSYRAGCMIMFALDPLHRGVSFSLSLALSLSLTHALLPRSPSIPRVV